jgi:S1-C subfamily serine protease
VGERPRILIAAAGLVTAATLGAGLALGGAAIFGGFGTQTTVRELADQSSGSPSPVSFAPSGDKRLSIHEIYRRYAPGVVQVTSTSVVSTTDPFFGLPQQQTQTALGSGFVIDKAGHIVTNYHVVAGAKSVEVSFSNNESMKARVVGVDPSTDIAVLQVKVRARGLTPLELGNSDTVQVGDSVVAIGNPLGLDRSVTLGIVSALQRAIQAPNSFSIDHVIQTDAAINHGNSGGPLLNTRGRVIGVNAQIQTEGGGQGNIGIGFAIPINTVRTVAAQLIKTGKVEHAYLGIKANAVTPDVARLFHLAVDHGLLVSEVEPGSAAAKAGVRAGTAQVTQAGESYMVGGDLIVKADDVSVPSLDRLRDVISAKEPGDTIRLQIYRNDTKLTIDAKLGRQPSSPQG